MIDEYHKIYELNSEIKLLSDLDKYKLKAVKFLLNECIAYDAGDTIIKAEDVTVH